jgi:hypothetical protein
MHALRIAHQGLELLSTGRITLPVGEPARSALREVRSGAVPLEEVLQRLDAATAGERQLRLGGEAVGWRVAARTPGPWTADDAGAPASPPSRG